MENGISSRHFHGFFKLSFFHFRINFTTILIQQIDRMLHIFLCCFRMDRADSKYGLSIENSSKYRCITAFEDPMGDLFIQNVLFFLCQIFWGIAEVDHCHLCRGDDLPVFFGFRASSAQTASWNPCSMQIRSDHFRAPAESAIV